MRRSIFDRVCKGVYCVLCPFESRQVFKENPYFAPTTLWKQVKFSEDEEEVDVTASEITWQEKAEVSEDPAKFAFFQVP